MNFDDIVWLPLFFCVCVFHPFVLLIPGSFFSSLSMSLQTFFFIHFQNIFGVNFLLTYLLFERTYESV